MKNSRLIIYVLVLCSFLCKTNPLMAHPGGHYHHHDHLDVWKLANGKQVEGNYSFARSGVVFLEQEDGKFISVPINQLSTQGRKLVEFKIKEYTQLNQPLPESKPAVSSTINYQQYLFIFCLLLTLLFFIYLISKYIGLGSVKGLSFLLVCAAFVGFAFRYSQIQKTEISFLKSVFEPYKNVKTTYNNDNFYVESNGIPNHNMMVGITNWQQQVPVPQNYTGDNHWAVPLQPVYATEVLSTKNNFMRGAIAIAANGIPIFNALNNRGEDSYLIGELDQWGGHCGKGDDYHYHVAPLCLQETSGLKPIAIALDGFPIYGDKEPDGSKMKPLDVFHGHEYANGYQYHGTKDYPYTIAAMRGVVKTDNVSGTENQIMPQAFASPLRPPLKPLRGATITDLKKIGAQAYSLTYQINGQTGFVNYSWDNQNQYIFENINPSGEKTANNYERKIRNKKN